MSESRPVSPKPDDIENLVEIIEAYKMTDTDANRLYRMLNEWTYAAGFSKGLLEMQELKLKTQRKDDL